MSHFLDRTNDAGGVFGVGIQDALLDAVLPTVPELPCLDLVVVRLLLPKDQQHQRLDGGTLERTIRVRDVL